MAWLAAAALAAMIWADNRPAWAYFLRVHAGWSPGYMIRTAFVPAFAAAAVAALAWALGRRVLRLGKVPAGPDAQVIAFGLGVGALTWGAMVLAFVGRLSLAGFAVLAAAALAAAAPELRAVMTERIPSSAQTTAPRPLTAAMSVILAYAGWHVFVLAAAPPSDWDVLAYHLALPKLYLRAGGMVSLPWLLYSHWPHLMEVFYALPLALGCDQAAALFHALLCGALVWAVFCAARRELGTACAWTGAALLAAQPVLLSVAPQAHSDGALALFFFSSCLAVWEWSKTRSSRLLAVAGALSGLAISCKLHGLVLAGVLAAWVCLRQAPAGQRLRSGAVFGACALAVCAPWFLKTYLETGNPVWPFFPHLLGGRGGPASLLSAYESALVWRFPRNLPQLLNYGPQFLLAPAAALLLLAGRRPSLPPFLRFLWLPPLVLLLMTAHYRDAWRFFLPGMPAFALSVAWWAEQAWRLGGGRKAAAAAAVAFGLWPALSATQNNQLFPFLGMRSTAEPGESPRQVYLERTVNQYRFVRRVNALGLRGKVLLVRDDRGYYLDADYLWSSPIEQSLIDFGALPDSAALASRLKELGVAYVFVDGDVPTLEYDDRRIRRLTDGMLAAFARPILRDGDMSLYRLR